MTVSGGRLSKESIKLKWAHEHEPKFNITGITKKSSLEDRQMEDTARGGCLCANARKLRRTPGWLVLQFTPPWENKLTAVGEAIQCVEHINTLSAIISTQLVLPARGTEEFWFVQKSVNICRQENYACSYARFLFLNKRLLLPTKAEQACNCSTQGWGRRLRSLRATWGKGEGWEEEEKEKKRLEAGFVFSLDKVPETYTC